MASPVALRPRINDLWADAANNLNYDERRNINFSVSDKRGIVEDVFKLAKASEQTAIEKQWRYTRKSGQIVILRDVFARVVHWVDRFKQVGDAAVQYDPVHAALPWAGIRFILQIAVNDIDKYASIVEGLALIAELICRYAVVEKLYPLSATETSHEMERALVKLYRNILLYLSRAMSYFDQSSAKRAVSSAFKDKSHFESNLSSIRAKQDDVERYMHLVERRDQVEHQDKLEHLLKHMNDPISRMDSALKDVQDKLNASRRNEILRWLSPEPYLQHHNQVKMDVLPDTGTWLLSDPTFRSWKKESASSILWLRGIPGSGKSKLVSIVIEDAFSAFEAGKSPAPAFFYSSRNSAEPTRSDPDAILASLARQLSSIQLGGPLLEPTVELYQTMEAQGFASGPLQIEQTCELIIQLAQKYPLITIVIDALDECNPAKRDDLLDALGKILKEAHSLVKIFVSSRNEQDIVSQLGLYPNLTINSDRNGGDIARFVTTKTEQLIKNGKLLRYSQNKSELEKLIVREISKGATGMFRWASLQLQYLCSCKLDAGIQDRLGRNPPDLDILYSEIYDMLSSGPAQFGKGVFRNALSWLLCAQETLKAREFLAAISIVPGQGFEQVSIDQVLDLCNNFIIYDEELDTFRFTHLSVREFLEKRDDYSNKHTNALAAEICLLHLISSAPSSISNEFPSEYHRSLCEKPRDPEPSESYSAWYWPEHCRLAADHRKFGRLKDVLWFFMSTETDNFLFNSWRRLTNNYNLISFQFPMQRRVSYRVLSRIEDASSSPLFAACAFDFAEYVEDQGKTPFFQADVINSRGRSLLEVAVRHYNLDTVKALVNQEGNKTRITEKVLARVAKRYQKSDILKLLLEKGGDEIRITEGILKAANKNQSSECMALLLKDRGHEIKITEKVLKAAAENRSSECMALLLDHGGHGIKITKSIVKAAARNFSESVMTVLLDPRSNEIQITEEVLMATAQNFVRGTEIMTLLFDRRDNEIQITEKMLIRVAQNRGCCTEIMTLLLARRSREVQITEKVLSAAAQNEGSDTEIMTLLLDRRGREVQITEKVLSAAAQNEEDGTEIMRLLFDRRGNEIQITEKVLSAAAQNEESGIWMMKLIFDRCSNNEIKITEEVLSAAAQNVRSGTKIMTLLLDRRGREVQITEKVLLAAAQNRHRGQEMTAWIFDRQQGDEFRITDKLLKAVSKRWYHGRKIRKFLMDRLQGDMIRITDEVVNLLRRAKDDPYWWDCGYNSDRDDFDEGSSNGTGSDERN